MKKEKILKNVLTKALIGCPIGITLLMISYISVYFFCNQFVFNNEMYQLHNVKTFILQIISVGIAGYSLFISMIICSKIDTIFASQNTYKSTLIFLLSFLCLTITTVILGNSKIFSKNICTLNLTMMLLFFALSCVVFFIKKLIEDYWIKKINQKIKNENVH